MKKHLLLLLTQIAFLYSAQGQFNYHSSIVANYGNTTKMTIGDYSTNGFKDILIAVFDQSTIIYYNDNSLNYYSDTLILSTGGPETTYNEDLDSDGDMDIITISEDYNQISWFENNNGVFSNSVGLDPSFDGSTFLQTGDLNNDGNIDMVSSYPLVRHTNNGLTQFITDTISTNKYSQFVLTDINGNGFKDIVTKGGTAFINSTGSFGGPIDLTNGTHWEEVFEIDFDNDADVDFITFYNDTIKLMENNGTGSFTNSTVISYTINNIHGLVIGDLDNDGYEDLLCNADSLFWFKNDGTGNFNLQVSISTNISWGQLKIGDLDNDSDLDIVVNAADSTTIFLNNLFSILISSINTQGQGGLTSISTLSGTLQMETAILPLNASNKNMTWSVVNGSGSASINPSGLLTAISNGTVTVTATANDASGISGSSVITISNQSTTIEELNINNISIFPNPTTDQLTIVSKELNINKVEIIDITCKLVKTITTDFSSVNVSNLQSGTYFIKLISDDKTITKKFVKQ